MKLSCYMKLSPLVPISKTKLCEFQVTQFSVPNTEEETHSIKASFLKLFYAVLEFQLMNSVFKNVKNASLKRFFKLCKNKEAVFN